MPRATSKKVMVMPHDIGMSKREKMLLVSDDVISDVVGISNPVPQLTVPPIRRYMRTRMALSPHLWSRLLMALSLQFTMYPIFFFVLCFMIMSGRECSRPDGDFMNKDGCNKHPFS